MYPYTYQQSGQSRVYVESLQENWSRLEGSALEWHSDAYLIEVSPPIFVDSPKSQERLVSAFFSSLSDTREMLVLMLNNNDEIHAETYQLSIPISDKPIVKSDWQIDSVDALARLLTKDDAEFLFSHIGTQCSDLSLRRWPNIPTKSVVWRIFVNDCTDAGYARYEYIDAMNGQRIEQR